ncbi:MAG: type II toxin-antitoxin system RelE/ParE family toxin [Coriobacteriia bacterium]|nr:type II toxin-antitoxin system RelE/ParE family toxin [Coriobacteriia bacterium]MCL2536770.1 type II toxin-antitoxin system RelE/ParE family toxin [Coriobacteriia bacterium]
MFQIEYYQLPSGRCPAKDFIEGLSDGAIASVLAIIDVLEKYGNLIGEPESKHIGKGLFELRTRTRDGQVRILYFFCRGRKCVITNGFIKKQSKVPQRQLLLAQKYKKDYLARCVNEKND